MSTRIPAFVVAALLSSVALSQVIYLPVQYQHGQQYRYYYGGNDPLIFARAERESALLAHRPVDGALPRVYSDMLPFVNGHLYGFAPSDACNQAYQSVPRYFHKRSIRETGYEEDGALFVPPTPPQHRMLHSAAAPTPAPSPAKKGVIIIIPKKNLETDAKPVSFVSAR